MRSHRFAIVLGRAGVRMALVAGSLKGQLLVKVVFRSDWAIQAYETLAAERDAIEAEVGATFEWTPNTNTQLRTVVLARPFRLHDAASWNDGIAWLADYAARTYTAFPGRLMTLPTQP
jgi:hypothetical protein